VELDLVEKDEDKLDKPKDEEELWKKIS